MGQAQEGTGHVWLDMDDNEEITPVRGEIFLKVLDLSGLAMVESCIPTPACNQLADPQLVQAEPTDISWPPPRPEDLLELAAPDGTSASAFEPYQPPCQSTRTPTSAPLDREALAAE